MILPLVPPGGPLLLVSLVHALLFCLRRFAHVFLKQESERLGKFLDKWNKGNGDKIKQGQTI